MTIHSKPKCDKYKFAKRRKCDGIYVNPFAFYMSHFDDNLPEPIKARKVKNKTVGPTSDNRGKMITLTPSLVVQPNFNQPGMNHLTADKKATIIKTNHFYILLFELPLFRAKQGHPGKETFETLLCLQRLCLNRVKGDYNDTGIISPKILSPLYCHVVVKREDLCRTQNEWYQRLCDLCRSEEPTKP